MSDDNFHELIERLLRAASPDRIGADEDCRSDVLNAQLANEAALAISELVATRAILMTKPDSWVHSVNLARRH